MRYTRYIAAFVALIVATACTVDDVDRTITPNGNGDKITVMGRISRFEDKEVTSRSAKDPATEGNLYNMAVALFRVENGTIGKCDFFEYKEGHEVLFTIDRQIRDANGDFVYAVDTPYVMYVFANCPQMASVTTDYTLEQMKAIVSSVSSISIPETDEKIGFPMMGSLGDDYTAEGDGKTFTLKPGSETAPSLPLVNGSESDLLTIPLSAIFAKINFTVRVSPDQTVEGKYSPRFTLNKWAVKNVPTSVQFGKDANTIGKSDTTDAVADYDGLPITSSTNQAAGANTVTFSFYLPERYLTPATESSEFDYPFPEADTSNGDIDANNNGYRDEDEKYMQRFKPLLPSANQNATYVTINGTFRDHQNHSYTVTYNIYLGENNTDNFNIKRNCEYNNYVTIRGISASDDMVNVGDGENAPVSIDHRVDVERLSPIIISLRRETLLDSHFEVRPIRVRYSPEFGDIEGLNAVQVEVVNPETTTWMRLERSNGVGTDAEGQSIYVTSGTAVGKRKYFTYNLVSGTNSAGEEDTSGYSLVNSTKVAVPLNESGECCWIYVDECTDKGDGIRSGTIKITAGSLAEDGTFTALTDSTGTPYSIEYTINQRKLFPVTYGSNEYLIEYHEEYLYNYDAEDDYGQTEEEGMPWGLNGVQLSHEYRAYFATGDFADIMNWLLSSDMDVAPYYDFYLTRDTDETSAKRRDNAGWDFTSEIVAYEPTEFEPITLVDKPSSAIEYCYNRNKRNADGSISNIEWYMPSIDQIENIMKGEYTMAAGGTEKTYIRFMEFQGKPYWSSQPAFLRGYGYYHSALIANENADYYFDDKTSARATKIVYTGNTTNPYENMSSGVDGYAQLMDIYKPLWGMSNKPVIHQVTSDNQTISCQGDKSVTIAKKTSKTNHPGNMLRTSKARVRCVRVAPPTTTTE